MFQTLNIRIRLCHDIRVNVYKQHTKCDWNQQQRLKPVPDRQVQEEACHQDHHIVSPFQIQKSCLVQEIV